MATQMQTDETGESVALTDGFHLVIDALKLNDIDTIYGVPGIPITDLGRFAQAAGMRVLSFRHEQNAGYAAAIAGYLTQKPGICLTVSAPGFRPLSVDLRRSEIRLWRYGTDTLFRPRTLFGAPRRQVQFALVPQHGPTGTWSSESEGLDER